MDVAWEGDADRLTALRSYLISPLLAGRFLYCAVT